MQKKRPSIIANEIYEEYIRSGKVPVGEHLPTVRVLAHKYGVSGATIVHALILLEKEGRIQRRHGSGCYVLDQPKDQPAFKYKLAFVRPRFRGDSVLPAIFAGMEAEAARSGYALVVKSSGESVEEEDAVLRELAESGMDGLILYPQPRNRVEDLNRVVQKHARIPMILVDLASDSTRCSRVVFDNFEAGFNMTRRLLEAGRKRIGFWMQHVETEESGSLFSVQQRYEGYLSCLREHGIEPRDKWIWHDVWKSPNADQNDSMLWEHLSHWKEGNSVERIDALLALDDVRAGIAINVAGSLGVRVPGDIAVTGFDDIASVQRVFNYAFPTTEPDFYKAGRVAFTTLLRQIEERVERELVYLLPAPVRWPENYLK